VRHTLVEALDSLFTLCVHLGQKLRRIRASKEAPTGMEGALHLVRVISFPDILWFLELDAKYLPVLFHENRLIVTADPLKDLG